MNKDIITALEIIRQKHGKGKPKKTIVDKIECPKCKGILHYSISSVNGHIWGNVRRINVLYG